MIRIITGYSYKGGSTLALKNLAREFNNRGIQCEMYGPHDWHLQFGNYCKKLQDCSINSNDKIISHFIDLRMPDNISCILSCHEMSWFDFTKISPYYKKVHFLTKKQADYHNSVKNYFFAPNIKDYFEFKRDDSSKNVAGIIGGIDQRKNTYYSIQRAIKDGCEKILIFGPIIDQNYFDEFVKPILSDKVIYQGYQPKELIYSSIDRVYHESRGEVASLVKDECYQTNTLFFGNEHTDNEVSKLTNDEIIKIWEKELQL